MSDIIEYIVKLKDEMSSGLNKLLHGTEAVNQKIEEQKALVGELQSTFLQFFAVTEIWRFGQEAVKAFDEASQASAQLTATLTSTRGAIGLTREQLDRQSESISRMTIYDHDAITSMQSLLATFTQVHGEIALQATPAIIDMASKMHIDLNSAAIQVGKALNDPIAGLTALRRVGVSFTESQRNVIKHLVETNQQAKAQQLILDELKTEFGGSAAAAAAAGTGPLQVFGHRIRELKEYIGSLITDGLIKMVNWFNRNEGTIKVVAEALAIIIGPIIALTIALKAWAIIQAILNAVMYANPIFLIVAAIAAVIAVVVIAYQHFVGFRNVMNKIWEVIKVVGLALWEYWIHPIINLYIWIGKLIWHTGILQKTWEGLKGVFRAVGDVLSWIWTNILQPMFAAIVFIYDKVRALVGVKPAAVETAASTVASPKEKIDAATSGLPPGINPTGTDTSSGAGSGTSKVSETKPTIITINIGKLIENFTVATTNLAETKERIREEVIKVVLSAVNDSQIIASP